MVFDGKKIRDQILADLAERIKKLSYKPTLAAIWIGEDFATARYIEAKQRVAEKLGIHFDLIKYPENVTMGEISQKIIELNGNDQVTGIMIQLPLSKQINQMKLIEMIDQNKDVDALRFCSELSCTFRPPTVLAILEAIEESGVDIKNKTIAVIGKGFLVGSPLIKTLDGKVADLRIADSNTPYLATITLDADIVISAVGKPEIIKANMVKDGVILIDAGTSESKGSLSGDIDQRAYAKASFYTPSPGGIGPVTIAMLMRNLVSAAEKHQNV